MENPADQLLIMEELSELSGALDFDSIHLSRIIFIRSETITEGTLASVQNEKANELNSSASLHQYAQTQNWLITGEENNADVTAPILEIILPLHVAEEKLRGLHSADGHDTIDDIGQLEKQITTQSLFVLPWGRAYRSGAWPVVSLVKSKPRSPDQAHRNMNEASQALALSARLPPLGHHITPDARTPESIGCLKTQLSDSTGSSLNHEGLEAVSRMEGLVDDVLRTLREYQGSVFIISP